MSQHVTPSELLSPYPALGAALPPRGAERERDGMLYGDQEKTRSTKAVRLSRIIPDAFVKVPGSKASSVMLHPKIRLGRPSATPTPMQTSHPDARCLPRYSCDKLVSRLGQTISSPNHALAHANHTLLHHLHCTTPPADVSSSPAPNHPSKPQSSIPQASHWWHIRHPPSTVPQHPDPNPGSPVIRPVPLPPAPGPIRVSLFSSMDPTACKHLAR